MNHLKIKKMKKIITILNIIIASVALFSACNPTKDFKDEYDLYNDPSKVKFADSVSVYSLTSADYSISTVPSISKNKYFTASYSVDPYILEILNKKYNAKISGSLTITYSYYNPLTLLDTVSYALVNGEYGNNYNDFSTMTELYSYLSKNYPTAKRGNVVILTYNWYVSSITVVSNSFICLGNNAWMIVTPFVLADYKAMGQNYANFSNTADAGYNIPIYLKNSFLPYAKSGDNLLVQYAVYASKITTQYFQQYTFNGTAWTAIGKVVPATTVVNFDGTVWKFPPPVKVVFFTDPAPANAISYTVTANDYKMVGNSYSDFDRRAGQSEGDDNVFLKKIGTILKTRFVASIAVDQVYAVTYADYSGTNPAPNKTIYVKVIPQ
jgi:hypothetical protein